MRDRGHKKWVSLMLPEHRALLDAWVDTLDDVDQPYLAEDRLEELQRVFEQLQHQPEAVEIRWFENKRIHIRNGELLRVDPYRQALLLRFEDGHDQWISFGCVLGIERP